MTKSILSCLLLSAALLPGTAPAQTAAPAQAQAKWTSFTPAEGMLTVEMPAAPTRSVTPIEAGKGGPGDAIFYTAIGAGGVFLAGWADYAPSFNFDNQAELEANRNNFVQGVSGKLLATRAITLNGAPGMEFDVQVPGQWVGRSRIYILGRTPYQLIAITPGATLDTANANRFFASFKTAPRR